MPTKGCRGSLGGFHHSEIVQVPYSLCLTLVACLRCENCEFLDETRKKDNLLLWSLDPDLEFPFSTLCQRFFLKRVIFIIYPAVSVDQASGEGGCQLAFVLCNHEACVLRGKENVFEAELLLVVICLNCLCLTS